MENRLEKFRKTRERQNARILEQNNKQVNRFFRLDSSAYEDGAVDTMTKEFCGLSASLVLRCDDCISYHVIRCKELGATDEQLFEIFNVALIVGGSIVIPHFRRAVDLLDEIKSAS